ncbi:FAD-dependent oxidoreductase [Streptomyces chartreusis]|nr:FAD-dependent oxidoreductase [Streptomyces chartreusis]
MDVHPPTPPSTSSTIATVGPRQAADFERCREAARAVLVLDPQNVPLTPRYLDIIERGLPKMATSHPKKILVIGAGPAGLLAAWLLHQAGHQVTIVEANGNRAGGRIKTFRAGGHERAAAPFADPRQYAEAGAMRIPGSHPLVMALLKKLRLKKRPFYYSDVDHEGHPAGHTWIYVNGIRTRRSDYNRDPQVINQSFGVPRLWWDTPASAILRQVLDPIRDEFSTVKDGKRVDKPLRECLDGWARVIQRFGDWSMYQFLTQYARLDERTIDLIGTLENLTSRLPLSFIHSFIGSYLISPDTVFWELEGGTAALPDSLLQHVGDLIRFDRRVTRIAYFVEGRPATDALHAHSNGPRVWVDSVSEGRDGVVVREQFTADAAVITVPFSGLRHVQFVPHLSYLKRRAIIELHYDSATKVLLEFSRRWWEFTEEDWRRQLEAVRPGLYDDYRTGQAPDDGSLLGVHPSVPAGHITPAQRAHYAANRSLTLVPPEAVGIIGGGSLSDNANRFVFHPSHPVPGSPGGVVLASYSWADDAAKWDSLDDEQRYPHALCGVQQVYGRRVEVFYTGCGRTQSWMRDPYAYGEAAVLLPGQHTELLPAIPTPEGPLHFGGCHTSAKPAWIEGALESAVRAALEVHSY